MESIRALPAKRTSLWRFVRKIGVGILATIGLLWVVGEPVIRWLTNPLYETEVIRAAYSPDRKALATVEVTRGGLGTVNTIRVHLQPVGEDRWTIYQARDSNFTPPLRWRDGQTLVVGLPCERFDYVSNPDDWERANPDDRRLKIRFEYPADC